MAYVRSIPVRDENGVDLTVHEFQERRFLVKVRRLELCTGEEVNNVDDDTFVVAATGELLKRLSA